MNLLFLGILLFFYYGVNGYQEISAASDSLAKAVDTTKQVLDIKHELDKIRNNRNKSNNRRVRRYSSRTFQSDPTSTLNKIGEGIGAILKTYLYQPIAHGNFLETTIRSYNFFHTPEGNAIFGTLGGELNQSFRTIMKNGHPRTGDIISCRIPTDRMAEHYMLVVNEKIAEVAVVGGKSTHNGVTIIDSYRKSSYINSSECLHHRNTVVLRAVNIDDANDNDVETDRVYGEILTRLDCTINGNSKGHFNYDLISCNCQDFVFYWAYGFQENNCVYNVFNKCASFSKSIAQIFNYIDEGGKLGKKLAEQRARDFDSMKFAYGG